jgi:hypothetical protein
MYFICMLHISNIVILHTHTHTHTHTHVYILYNSTVVYVLVVGSVYCTGMYTKVLLVVSTNTICNLFQILLSGAYGVLWRGNLIKRSSVVHLTCNVTRGYILIITVTADSGSVYGNFNRIIKSVR